MSETLPIALDRFKDLVDKYRFEEGVEGDTKLAVELVMAAYERPSYSIEELQRDEISRFENSAFRDCYKATTFDSEE